MTAIATFNLLEPLAVKAVVAMPDGEDKSVVTFILKCADSVKADIADPATATGPDKLAAFADKALPHLQAVLPSAGVVGSIVAVTIDLAEFIAEETETPTGTIVQKCGDDGLPLADAPAGNV